MRGGIGAKSWVVALSATAMAVLFAGCSGAAATPTARSGGAVVTFGELANSPPTYIFPMESGTYFTNQNLYQFSNQLYVPLYSFGDQGQPVLNPELSVASSPVFSDNNTVVSITLKHWQWSNGQPITSRDVIFWMNLLSAVTDPNSPAVGSTSAPGPGWGAAVPGGFPMNVVSYQATRTYSLSMKLNLSYNPTWFLHNELSQVYPLPAKVWDKLSTSGSIGNYEASAETRVAVAGTSPIEYVPQNPGTGTTGALGAAQFLSSQSQTLSTYATNPLWRVVDGPFGLKQFTPSGYLKLVPNKEYSGSLKPTISAFVEEPFTSDSAEFDALKAGSLTIGYIPTQDLHQKNSLEKAGYSFAPWYGYGVGYFSYNYTDPKAGPIFRQLYFRQAVQSLVNQPEYIKDFDAGYGTVENGPVPTYPPGNRFESSQEQKRLLYPYRPAKAVSLLKDAGWHVVTGGISYCAKAGTGVGECGPGITAHQELAFTMLYPSGSLEATNQMDALQSTLKLKAGISLTLRSSPYQQVTGIALNGCTYANPCSDWELSNWVGYWTYAPDYLPTGEELFAPGAASNGGDYSNATNNANIDATETAPTDSAEIAALDKYQNYLAGQVPVIYVPDAPLQLTMFKSDLRGLVPQNVFDIIEPQAYRFAA
jgi:peptide/nickel transport system substrate-binding protein